MTSMGVHIYYLTNHLIEHTDQEADQTKNDFIDYAGKLKLTLL